MDGSALHCTEGSDQNYPKEKEMQEGKVVSEEALQITKESRDVKSKAEKERYTQMNGRVPASSKERLGLK